MRFQLYTLAILASLLGVNCTNQVSKPKESSTWVKPEAGTSFNLGDKVQLALQIPENIKYDSIVILVDTLRMSVMKNTKPISISTDTLGLGYRLITARIFSARQSEDVSTNIILKSTLVPKKLNYKVEHVFPHDTSSYVEGLEYHQGYLYESAGEYGKSSVHKLDITTGKVLQKTNIRPEIFGEGITIIGDKILQLTYKENLGIVYNLNTLKPIKEFPCQNTREGWGLCFDGKRIYNTDGSNTIYFLNKDTFRDEGYIEVYDQNGPVEHLNELEYIDGKLYANVFMTNRIVIINPKNGQVTAEIDLSNLHFTQNQNPSADVLNGIAWDKQGKRLFVTGKKWDKLFQIKLL